MRLAFFIVPDTNTMHWPQYFYRRNCFHLRIQANITVFKTVNRNTELTIQFSSGMKFPKPPAEKPLNRHSPSDTTGEKGLHVPDGADMQWQN